ncbi:hypothetical protein [Aurantiacibacter suaedae]|uniref:hypothetical protein n=1 Tax=Aurantiacibacter suaedae TaxID=2545755 RepID=UPI0010F8260C|nr:hypothetical protein [Aurantiacibacter suaedae]
MQRHLAIAVLGLAPLTGGCLAKTAFDVATAPVRVVSQGADWATTSQDEADRNRGREMRRREARLGDLQSDYEREADRCERGREESCREAIAIRREIDSELNEPLR